MKIAIIGAGISGLGAAWLLHKTHDITLYEKEPRLGGHTNTQCIDYDGTPLKVDTGFIVYNELNYPNLTALFRELGVETRASDMSFAFSRAGTTNEWSGVDLGTIFTWRRNMVRPGFWAMLGEILRFNRMSADDLATGRTEGLSLKTWLDERGFTTRFREHYLLPMGAAIWSTSPSDMLAFPATSFIQFFVNHRLINKKAERPQWRTVVGGSNSYLTPLTTGFRNRIHTGVNITRILRDPSGARICFKDGTVQTYDAVILACHSDQALALLGDPSPAEQALLGAIRYAPNTAWLHRDVRLMPRRNRAWASWNYMCDGQSTAAASVTYWMNRLQGLDADKPVFVTLNPATPPDPALTFGRFDYMHPQFDAGALLAQKSLDAIQGQNKTFFCGAWTGYGFHEDGLASGLAVAERLGAQRPWQARPREDIVPGLAIAAD